MARYRVLLTRSAAKELELVPTKERLRIVNRIGALAEDPRPAGAEKLSGDDKYRIRQGNYRIPYEIVDTELVVTVVRVGHRRQVYRR